MREVILGTAGHVDHGKTSLIRALTGIDCDRLKEEKERGITIELGFAFLDLPCGHRLGIVDVPGHEKFVRNMVAGAAGLDLVAFIIAADAGIMPQTKEHFEICKLLGIDRGLIIITKTDLVDPEWLELMEEEVRDYFSGTFLENAPLHTVSSATGAGVKEVLATLDRLVADTEFIEAHGPFRLPVDRVFSMKGFGAVVTGTSVSGRIGVGDELMFYPRRLPAKIRGIQVHGEEVKEAEAGHRTAVNIHGLDKTRIRRGDVAATPDSLQPSYLLDADLQYLTGNRKPLKNRTRVRVHLGTAEIMGRIILLEAEELPAGERANVQLRLEEPVGVWPGDRYVIRSYSPVFTIGGGGILNASPPKRKRFREENRLIFKIYHRGTPAERAEQQVRESGLHGLTLDRLAVKTGIFGNRLKKTLQQPLSTRRLLVVESDKQRLLAADVFADLAARSRELLAEYHQSNPLLPGISKDELRARLHRSLDQRLFQFLLNELIKQGTVAQEEGAIRLAGHRVSLAEHEQALRRELDQRFRDAGLAVPTVKEVVAEFGRYPEQQVREVLAVMQRENTLIKVKEDLNVHASNLEALREQLVEFMEGEGEIDAPRFKNLTGLTRKYTIPLLEYFDRIRLTIRVGDKRILREQAK